MQLEMLQEDLFSEAQDTRHNAPSKNSLSSDTSESPYKKLELADASSASPFALMSADRSQSSDQKPGQPPAQKPDVSKPVLVEQEMPSTATLRDVPPEDSSPISTVLPVLGHSVMAEHISRSPVLEMNPPSMIGDDDMPDDLYNDAHHSPELEMDAPDMEVLDIEAGEPIAEEEMDEVDDSDVHDAGPVIETEGKAPGAFKTISEAAGLLGVPQHVLRFWESRFAQIKPLKMRGGRRYYRPEDMEILSTIKHLLYKQGYTIKGAKKVFSTRNREALDAAHRESVVPPVPAVAKKVIEKIIEKPVVLEKPVFDDRKKKQLSNIRNELLGLRDTLSVYL